MESWKTDVAVLLVFFVRDNTFKQVFESVKKARPRKLLLWQDGPRSDKPSDFEGIRKCREIVDTIDWDCEVHKFYNEKNLGCDPSTFYAFRWAFSIVDKCIILEDDQVPSQSYFLFCKELLDRYEKDERINHICGYNIFGEADWCPNDYLFSYTGSGAWASWRRVAEKWDSEYSFLHDDYYLKNLACHYGKRSKLWLNNAKRHEATMKAFWETIIGLGCTLDSRYAIIPKYNLVQNLGISENATHSSVSDLRLIDTEEQKLYTTIGKEIQFPLKHPKYIIADAEYVNKLDKRNNPGCIRSVSNKIQMALNMIKFGQIDHLIKAISRRIIRNK